MLWTTNLKGINWYTIYCYNPDTDWILYILSNDSPSSYWNAKPYHLIIAYVPSKLKMGTNQQTWYTVISTWIRTLTFRFLWKDAYKHLYKTFLKFFEDRESSLESSFATPEWLSTYLWVVLYLMSFFFTLLALGRGYRVTVSFLMFPFSLFSPSFLHTVFTFCHFPLLSLLFLSTFLFTKFVII